MILDKLMAGSMVVGSGVYVGLLAAQALTRLAVLALGWAAGMERVMSW